MTDMYTAQDPTTQYPRPPFPPQQLIERRIRVNGVAPGPIWTPLQPAFVPNEKIEHFGEQTPIGRAGQPVELAPAYVFLASQESSYVVGETIAVTGGMTLT